MDPDSLNLQELEKKYEDILEQNPRSGTFVLLAEVLIKRRKLKRAIEVLNKGLSSNRDNITARFLLGRIYYDNWMIDQAKKHFEYILSVSPDNLASVNYLVEIYRSEGKPEKALEITEKALFYFPDNKEITKIKDSLQTEITDGNTIAGHIGGSVKHFGDTGRDVIENDSLVSETLADIYLQQGYYDDCIKICEKLQMEKNDPAIVEKKDRAIKLLFRSSKSGS